MSSARSEKEVDMDSLDARRRVSAIKKEQQFSKKAGRRPAGAGTQGVSPGGFPGRMYRRKQRRKGAEPSKTATPSC